MMLTTDVANKNDPEYWKLVKAYAADITVLENDFEHAWYKLTTQVRASAGGGSLR